MTLTIDQYAQNFGEEAYPLKPVIMGEFGAPSLSFGTASAAAQALAAWQTGSCQHNFAGWIMWTWDTTEQPGGNFWAMTSADSVIETSLAPVRRGNPCSA